MFPTPVLSVFSIIHPGPDADLDPDTLQKQFKALKVLMVAPACLPPSTDRQWAGDADLTIMPKRDRARSTRTCSWERHQTLTTAFPFATDTRHWRHSSTAAVVLILILGHLLAVVPADDNASLLELLPPFLLQVTAEPLARLDCCPEQQQQQQARHLVSRIHT